MLRYLAFILAAGDTGSILSMPIVTVGFLTPPSAILSAPENNPKKKSRCRLDLHP